MGIEAALKKALEKAVSSRQPVPPDVLSPGNSPDLKGTIVAERLLARLHQEAALFPRSSHQALTNEILLAECRPPGRNH